MERVRVGVIGAGGWGSNHLRVFRSLSEAELVGFVEGDTARRAAAESEHGTPGFESLADLARAGAQAVTIAVPTPLHRALALEAIDLGLHILVEKPIAGTLEDADAIIAAAHARGLRLHVGHVERWNGAFEALAARCRRPRFVEVHRLAPFNPRGTDVAVVLDLMIHDLDGVLALIGEPIERVDAVGVAVLSREIDIANARIEFAGGAIANLTASRISREKVRKLRVFEHDTYLAADLVTRQVECFRRHPAPGSTPPFRIEQEPVDVIAEEPLTRELRAFVQSVATGEPARVGGAAGRAALDAATRVLAAIAARGEEPLPGPGWPPGSRGTGGHA